jgi:ABC-2 type transport system permease protein
LRAAAARAYPRVIGANREVSWLFFEIAIPLINTTAFVFLYKALHAPEAFIGFVILGAVMATYWLNVLWMMASQLYWDKQEGFLELYIMAPTSTMAILLGMGVGGLYMSTLRAATIAVLGTVIFGVKFDFSQWGFALLVFLVAMFALYGLGMTLSSVFLMWGREAWQVTQALIEPVYFVSGLNFPVGRLGFVGALAISTIPFAVGLDAMRQLAFPGAAGLGGTPGPDVEALILVLMTVVFVLLARVMIRSIERMARREGRLSIRWQ